MDEFTLRHYAAHAHEIAQRYDSVEPQMENLLQRAFGEEMRVLDIGAGSGRDLSILLKMGCDAYGVEPCDELRAVALQRRPQLVGRLAPGGLPKLGQPFDGNFDGVLCSAVLMHLPRADILECAVAIRNVLKENGRLLLSIPMARPGLDENERDKHGRLFTDFQPDYLQLLFERVGFQLIEHWQSRDSLNRYGHAWHNLLFRARHPGGSRPLDEIEGILNRDRKTATYKLALFRALSEIATTEFEQARWVSEGVVGIPVAAVCEKWIHYYWPVFESAGFIPQIRGEGPTCSNPVAFRSSLSGLIQYYARLGGLTRFVLDFRGGNLPNDVMPLVDRVRSTVQNTIVKGPVTYAGGSLESGRVFQYDRRTQEIRMIAALWRELSLVGHWIQDAVILRWAELTSEISQRALRPSEVIDLLLTVPIPERDVTYARTAYSEAGITECTWSGARLRKAFHVDHIIPFSLWRNNDLWNLVPVSPSVNSAKSDKLPSRDLLLYRRERIIGYWEILRVAHKGRFDYEMRRITGVNSLPDNWQDLAFRCVSESVEFMAVQRGSARWEP